MCFDRSFPATEVIQFARQLEDGGADDLWVIEDCFYTAGISLAAAALSTTQQLTVGIGILPAVARNPAITAMEIATLCQLAPGRVVAGIGHGVQSWMAQMGVRPQSPVTALEEVLVAVRRLLARRGGVRPGAVCQPRRGTSRPAAGSASDGALGCARSQVGGDVRPRRRRTRAGRAG